MIYRRLFHTRASFASWYIINFAVIIRVSFVYCYFYNILIVCVYRLCIEVYRYIFCFIRKKVVSLHYHLTITILCNWLGNNQRHTF